MRRKNNYALQAQQAKQRFLSYDAQALIRKFRLEADADFLYLRFLGQRLRIERATGDMYRQSGSQWLDANSFEEILTVFDLLCDSREDRSLSGRWKSMQSFGLQFHRNLLEEGRDARADAVERDPEAFRNACLSLGGVYFPGADMGYAVELFDGLRIAVQFWHGDEEFAPRLRYLWDENATQFLRYETMYYAVACLPCRLAECK